jgi:hypothetical protein
VLPITFPDPRAAKILQFKERTTPPLRKQLVVKDTRLAN